MRLGEFNLFNLYWNFYQNGELILGFSIAKLGNQTSFDRSLVGFHYFKSILGGKVSTYYTINIVYFELRF